MRLWNVRIWAVALLLLSCKPGDSPSQEGSSKTPSQQERIAKAKQLLTEAGYPDGKGLPTVEILYNTLEAHKKIAAAIQHMWKTSLGVTVELRNTEWKTYLEQLTNLDYQVVRRYRATYYLVRQKHGLMM